MEMTLIELLNAIAYGIALGAVGFFLFWGIIWVSRAITHTKPKRTKR